MTESDAREVVMLLRAATTTPISADTIDYFSVALLPFDYEAALTAATKGVRVHWRRFPSWFEFREAYNAELKLRDDDGRSAQDAMPKRTEEGGGKKTIPFWVKRWIAARFLFTRWGRDQDLRPFTEQKDRLTSLAGEIEWMPEDEWVEEANHVSDDDVWGRFDGTSPAF
jgi:hypothetical protein